MTRALRLAALLAALVLGALAAGPASARDHRHGRHQGQHHGHRGHHHHGRGHHGYGHRGGPHHGRPRFAAPDGRLRRGPRVVVERAPVFVGSRRVDVVRPGRVYGRGAYAGSPYGDPAFVRPAGYGPGCTTTRRVGFTPWGWRKIVTTRTCLVP